MTVAVKRALALLGAPALAMSLLGCASTVSTTAFKGEQREVAQAISSLQADVTAGDQQKICANDLASAVVARLNAARGGCKQAIKNQLAEVDSYNVSIQSVQVSAAGAQRRASAHVKSVYSGKTRSGTLSLLKEGSKWKVAGSG
jgi:hypothetical protein